uniref:Uncharacterized protein n=1 Tax=Anguilla anguilla TaxID=7936 RepID=A0A0E9S830_ANGAN
METPITKILVGFGGGACGGTPPTTVLEPHKILV